jgi:3',5'-cyclic-AMP phosphodiesterase
MLRLAWLTDIHLNFVEPAQVDDLCRSVVDNGADAVLLTGDIAEAVDVVDHLQALDDRIGLPLYFVLGNHDFYRGSIAGVRGAIAELCARRPRLHWLPGSGVVELTPETGLVGHDGWADGRLGDYAGSEVMLNDYWLIEELAGLDRAGRLEQLHALGDEAADHFRRILPAALGRFRRLVVLTHVPPFREACWHDGQVSGNDWLPHFACRATGEALFEAAAGSPDRELTVLCGHTHSPGEAQVLPNLRVLTGGAEYGRPEVQAVMDIG